MSFQVFRSKRFVSVVALILFGSVASIAQAAQTCSGSSPQVCVERADLSPPVVNTDFAFDFTDSSNPDVTFKTGHNTNPWRVWSQVSMFDSTPADLGDLFIESSGTTDNYTVEIKNPNTSGPGAANVKSAVLNDTTNWSGYSSIGSGSHITGDLTGNLEVVAGGDSGGEVSLTIDGNAQGNLTMPKMSSMSIGGDYSGVMAIAEVVAGGTLGIAGNVALGSSLTIGQMGEGAGLGLGSGEAGTFVFRGSLLLESGIPYGSLVYVLAALVNPGSIDLNDVGAEGDLILIAGGNGSIVHGGTIVGLVWLAASDDAEFSGTAAFDAVPGGVRTELGNISGSVVVAGDVSGSIGPDPGNLTSAGSISIGGNLSGSVYATSIATTDGNLVGPIDVGGDVSGLIAADRELVE